MNTVFPNEGLNNLSSACLAASRVLPPLLSPELVRQQVARMFEICQMIVDLRGIFKEEAVKTFLIWYHHDRTISDLIPQLQKLNHGERMNLIFSRSGTMTPDIRNSFASYFQGEIRSISVLVEEDSTFSVEPESPTVLVAPIKLVPYLGRKSKLRENEVPFKSFRARVFRVNVHLFLSELEMEVRGSLEPTLAVFNYRDQRQEVPILSQTRYHFAFSSLIFFDTCRPMGSNKFVYISFWSKDGFQIGERQRFPLIALATIKTRKK